MQQGYQLINVPTHKQNIAEDPYVPLVQFKESSIGLGWDIGGLTEQVYAERLRNRKPDGGGKGH